MTGQLVDPDTGEVTDLAGAPDVLLARTLDDLDAQRNELTDWRRAVAAEVLRRMDNAARWTIHAGPFKLHAPSPLAAEYDARPLWDDLQILIAAGRFGQEALDAAIEQVTTFKPRAAGLKALAKLGPDVAAVIERNTHTVEKPRGVRVTRI
jgi:hypothetical protein